MASKRRISLRIRFGKEVESLSPGTRDLLPLRIGDSCRVQNQTGFSPTKWDRTGVIVQVNDHNQYLVKMHGSGRITLRNRKFLRKIQPYLSDHRRPVPPCISTLPPASAAQEETNQIEKSNTFHQGVSGPGTVTGSSTAPPSGIINEPIAPLSNASPPVSPMIIDAESSAGQDPSSQEQLPNDCNTVTTPRPSRERRAPLWHSDYKMD